MKYLERYNNPSSKHYDSLRQDLEDISVEFRDMGLRVGINNHSIIINYIKTINSYAYKIIKWDHDIRDCLLRIKDYLGDKYEKFQYYHQNHGWVTVKLTDKVEIGGKITHLKIEFREN